MGWSHRAWTPPAGRRRPREPMRGRIRGLKRAATGALPPASLREPAPDLDLFRHDTTSLDQNLTDQAGVSRRRQDVERRCPGAAGMLSPEASCKPRSKMAIDPRPSARGFKIGGTHPGKPKPPQIRSVGSRRLHCRCRRQQKPWANAATSSTMVCREGSRRAVWHACVKVPSRARYHPTPARPVCQEWPEAPRPLHCMHARVPPA